MSLDLYGRGTLVVSLPKNDPELARAAQEGGADLLKVHVNVHHRASGNGFGSLEEEGERIRQVAAVGLPVGLVPGEEAMITPEETERLSQWGISFIDVYLSHLRLYLYRSGLPVIPAINAGTPPHLWTGLRALPGDWLEASVVPKEGYGQEARGEDLAVLAAVGQATGRKLLVPSQRAMDPEDLGLYFRVPEVHAIMIGAVVTGQEPDSLYQATAAFRRSLDRLRAKGWV
ncbi:MULTISPECIES: hypothetical protein [Limnochorda]|uniref:hypothetical protein n=1 Tax=Limnochorda TaxID=1676651 RepID=UPI0017FF9A7D|nr:hypothetical protein [Limnochorda pilosa]MBO2487186.1 hypothetical protein [Bacillota bacterium]NMA71876.1 hypothetical protein [Bacillota bacterium]